MKAYRSHYSTLIEKELRTMYREKTVLFSFVIIWGALLTAGLFTLLQYRQEQQRRQDANTMFVRQWEQQERNPHAAAHFGTYIFKPLNLAGAFDPGLDEYSGTTYRIEAHVQHEVDHSQAQGSDASARFGPFSISLVLQLMVPLLVMVTAAVSVTAEKEAGTLKMLLVQGRYSTAIIWSKVWAHYLLFAGMLLPFFGLYFTGAAIAAGRNDLWSRSAVIVGAYLLYYLLIVVIAVSISALSSSSRSATMNVLLCWLCFSIILPKVAASQANKAFPVMPRAVFEDQVKQGYLKGLNGHDPYYERSERYLKQILQQYHANSLSQLPVDADGIIMQYHEDYRQQVFHHYYSKVAQSFSRQQSFLSRAGMLDPFIGLKRISMSMSGTDYYAHQAFYQQAQLYRDYFIRTLNMELAAHPGKSYGSYKAGPEFFRQIKKFSHTLPPVQAAVLQQRLGFVSLCTWILLAFFCLHLISKRGLFH
ncbi:DUF3526 domain-containing protein [Chitinophaga polysaccharea]|uniref:DUF3526 domain-containing protein n=1 Tax=Chitinophaga polysaccharea TaxID=1293035 RepID=UPI00115ACA96|nr:DUF3526 domain-containing protein [Chitinophaga polysaccharea]